MLASRLTEVPTNHVERTCTLRVDLLDQATPFDGLGSDLEANVVQLLVDVGIDLLVGLIAPVRCLRLKGQTVGVAGLDQQLLGSGGVVFVGFDGVVILLYSRRERCTQGTAMALEEAVHKTFDID